MIYKQITPMQWITLYYNGDCPEKIKKIKEGKGQMRRFIRYSNVIEEIKKEKLEILSDTDKRVVGITPEGVIAMFENNISQ